jgi:hypothetical protein
VGFQGTQFIPASGMLRWFNKIVDPTYRKPVTIMETIEAGIPGLSQDVKAYKDQNGMDAHRPWTDVYLPYTLGEENVAEEQKLQNRNTAIRMSRAQSAMKAEVKDAQAEAIRAKNPNLHPDTAAIIAKYRNKVEDIRKGNARQ